MATPSSSSFKLSLHSIFTGFIFVVTVSQVIFGRPKKIPSQHYELHGVLKEVYRLPQVFL